MNAARVGLLAVVLAAACRTSSAPVPSAAQTNAYVLRLGNDTLAVDQATRVGSRLEGTLVTHLPRTLVTRYVVTLDPATGMATLLEFNTRLPDGSMPPAPNQAPLRQATITFSADGATRQDRRDTLITSGVSAPNTVPYINYAVAFIQLPISVLRAARRDTMTFQVYTGGRTTTPMVVTRLGATRYLMKVGPYPYDIVTDRGGVVQSVDASRTTQNYQAARQNSVDVAGLAAIWWQREKESAPRAALSPRDTVRARVGAAEITIDYGRPFARGRRVFGSSGVLNDTLWRTGANRATHFSTSAPIRVAGETIPAGTYTLWTLAVPGRYQLIFNRQTGQWGTEYDPKQDQARVPMELESLPRVLDQFTIAVESTGAASGILRLRWDTTELSVPFTVP